jgi:hypothetical protein
MKLLVIFSSLFFLIASFPAKADQAYYFSPTGLDTNDCLTPTTACATLQHGVVISPVGVPVVFNLADGEYSGACPLVNNTHYRYITIPGNSTNPTAISLACSGSGPLLWVQDHAELITENLLLKAYSNGVIAAASRQYSIADLTGVTFSSFPGGSFAAASEDSKINIASSTMAANSAGSAGAGCGFQAIGHGHISMGAFKFSASTDSSITGPLACGDDYGILDFSSSVFSGPGSWGGQQYSIGAAEIKRPATGMPGSGTSTDAWSIVR